MAYEIKVTHLRTKAYSIRYVFIFVKNPLPMEVTTFTGFRRNMKAYFDQVFNMGKPLFIARPKGQDMVLISKNEYNSMEETLHLLRSPKNADRLLEAVKADKAGEVSLHKLSD